MKTLSLILLAVVAAIPALSQTSTETINKELVFEKPGNNTLMVANINGDITVTGYDGDKVIIEVSKTIRAKSNERLEKGKKEIQLGVIDRMDTLILYTSGLCSPFGKNNGCNNNDSRHKWSYSWCNCQNSCREEYDYTMDYTIKVPRAVNLILSTVNDGNIQTGNMLGTVSAENINGSINLKGLVREARVSTINGDVDIEYAKNPDKDCRFYTLNGDINAWFQKGLAANLSFDSFNGEFFTNIDRVTMLPATVEKAEGKEGIKFKVGNNRYKVGNGGALLDFETFNGNVYLKEKTN